MQEWQKAPVVGGWESAPIAPPEMVSVPTAADIPTTEGSTLGQDRLRENAPQQRTFGSEFGKNFNEAVGSRVGLDNYDTVHNYLGPLTPLIQVPAQIGDTMMGTAQGLAFGVPQVAENVGLLGKNQGRQMGRDLMSLGESAGIVSGMMPSISTYGATSRLPKTAKPPSQLADNVRALENSGVNPSLAVASDTPAVRGLAGGIENLPVVGGPLQNSAEQAAIGIKNRAEDLIGQVGRAGDDVSIGDMVRTGLQRYARSPSEGYNIKAPARETSIASKAEALYNRAGIDGDITINPLNTLENIGPVVTKYSDETFGNVFKNTNISKIAERLKTGEPVSYNDLKQFRRDLYKLKKGDSMTADVDSRDIDRLYSGVTKDLEEIAMSQGKLKEFRRAEKFWSKAQDRISGALKKYAKDDISEEAIYGRIERASKEGSMGNIKDLRVLRNSLKKDEWGDVAATVFQRLGTKGEEGFNVNHFITNYNKLSPQARELLTSQTPHLRGAFDDLAKATELLQRYDRSRPRGSANMQSTLATIGATADATASYMSGGIPWFSILAAGAGRITGNMLASPRFVKLLARTKRAEAQAAQGKNIDIPLQSITRDMYLLGASNDVSAADVKSLLSTLGPDRAAAKEKEQQ